MRQSSRDHSSRDVVAEVKQANDIVDVVQGFLDLTSAGGGRFKALCPFHKEKTPSFFVNRERQSFYCFGCEKGGDIITFVQELNGLSFQEALQTLADKAGINIERVRGAGNRTGDDLRRQVLRLTTFACRLYSQKLSNPLGGGVARRYLESRNVAPEIVERFGLGFAPDDWDTLAGAARAKGVSERVLEASGLCKRGAKGTLYDHFRNRIVFPIRDLSGNAVAFGGRALDDNPAKYINSPENAVYKKARILYGLYEARDALRGAGRAILVEGYFDLLRCAEAGFEHVVATCGTALTSEQASLLRRYVREVIVLYDGDAAGVRAALRSVGILTAAGLSVRAVSLPGGQDPDDYIRQEGREAFRKLLDEAMPFVPFYVRMNSDRTGTIEGRTELAKELFAVIRDIDEVIRQDEYLKQVAEALRLDPYRCREEYQRFVRGRSKPAGPAAGPSPEPRVDPFMREFLECVLAYSDLLERCRDDLEALGLVSPELAEVVGAVLATPGGIPPVLVTDYAKKLYAAGATGEAPPKDRATEIVAETLSAYRRRSLVSQRDEIQEEIRRAERLNDGSELEKLALRKIELDRRIQKLTLA